MKKKKLKVAVVYNEAAPELYHKTAETETSTGNFIPYFEVEEFTPMEEFEYIAKKLQKVGFDAYTLNILDNIQSMLDNFKQNKPDIVFNFVELYKEEPRYEMNVVGLYELLGIPYTGASAMALANCQSKMILFSENEITSIDHNISVSYIAYVAYQVAIFHRNNMKGLGRFYTEKTSHFTALDKKVY